MKAPTAAELRKQASALGLTLVGNARLKATKEAWQAEIEAAKTGKVVPISSIGSTGTQEDLTATKYVTVDQAQKAAKAKGYTIKVDQQAMKIHIYDGEGKTAATVWLTSDVIKWLRTAPKVTIEIETTDDINEVEKPSEVATVLEAVTAIAEVAEVTVTPEPVKPAKKAPKAPKLDKEAMRAENETRASEIRETLEMMGGQAFQVTDWLTFQAKIFQGSKTLGFVGVSLMTGKPWYRPLDAKISKSVQFPVNSLAQAVSKVILWHMTENQESA